MEIGLSPELEAAVERAVAGGAVWYVAAAVELLEERERWLGESVEEFNAKLEASIAGAERGSC